MDPILITSSEEHFPDQKSEQASVAFREIQALLAVRRILDVKVEDIQTIASKYGINLKKQFPNQWFDFYKEYLRHCLHDNSLTEDELFNLKHLKQLLYITDNEINDLHNEVSSEVYQLELENALRDGKLTEEEKVFLHRLREELRLPNELANRIYSEITEDVIARFLRDAISDKQLSPDEESELQALVTNLEVNLVVSNATKSDLLKYRFFWLLENKGLVEIDVSLDGYENENVYFHHIGTYWKSINLFGFELSNIEAKIKAYKGAIWTLLNCKEFSPASKGWQKIAVGHLYLTGNFLYFNSKLQQKAVKIQEISDFKAHLNGVKLSLTTGEELFFELSKNADVLVMVLGQVIKRFT